MTALTKLAATFGVLLAYASPGFAADAPLFHVWEADSQTRAGKTVSCYIQLLAATDREIVTMNLSLFAQAIPPEKIQMFTALKITASRHGDGRKQIPVKLYAGWIRSSSGSTVGRLKPAGGENSFLGAAPGAEVFTDILKGIGTDGVSVGYQEKPGTFDKVIKVSEPLPPGNWQTLGSCLRDLQQTLQ